MSALMFVEGLGHADHCAVSSTHRPPGTLRWVWHHILPQVCGGLTEPANLAPLCDSCHYTVHILMWHLAASLPVDPGWGLRRQRALAQTGYLEARAAGTDGKIPKEADA